MALSIAACGEEELPGHSPAPGMDESGMAAKELYLLEEGDVITIIWRPASYSGDDDFEMCAIYDLTVTADTSFGETPLPDGQYVMVFEMWDAVGNSAYSDTVTFDCADGEIEKIPGSPGIFSF